jgi:DNA invertase Pin-like site-specific DNA recombinase
MSLGVCKETLRPTTESGVESSRETAPAIAATTRAYRGLACSSTVDTSTPMGKMVFTVLGAVAELERSLIVERVRAGLRNARAKGKRLGRPRVSVSLAKIHTLRAAGLTLREIAMRCGISKTSVIRALNQQ